jgi:DNA (cytosine-5)-methyltransferase 1
VLAERWPEVINLGDMTKIAAAVRTGEVQAPDVMVGGTPCQAFSIAGLRNGLADARGQLTLSYVELANAIDDKRIERGRRSNLRLGKRPRSPHKLRQRFWLLSGRTCRRKL